MYFQLWKAFNDKKDDHVRRKYYQVLGETKVCDQLMQQQYL